LGNLNDSLSHRRIDDKSSVDLYGDCCMLSHKFSWWKSFCWKWLKLLFPSSCLVFVDFHCCLILKPEFSSLLPPMFLYFHVFLKYSILTEIFFRTTLVVLLDDHLVLCICCFRSLFGSVKLLDCHRWVFENVLFLYCLAIGCVRREYLILLSSLKRCSSLSFWYHRFWCYLPRLYRNRYL